MLHSSRFLSILAIFVFALVSVNGLDCGDKIKVFVKLSNPDQFDEMEYYLFRSITAYAIRDYCGEVTTSCPSGAAATTDTDVVISDETKRVSFCMVVGTIDNGFVRSSINSSLERYYGGLQLTKEVLQIEGVDPILEEAADPSFPIWLIPFIVIAGLVLLAGLAMTYFSLKDSKEVPSDEKETLTGSEDSDVEVGHRGPGDMHDDEQRTEL